VATLFWDASALAKRYFAEIGSDVVDVVFDCSAGHSVATSPWGYVEAYSVLLRRLNAGVISAATFAGAVLTLQADVIYNPKLRLLNVSDGVIFSSIVMMRRHNLNATDAALLTMLLEYTVAAPADGPLVVVAADQRLLRAAAAEGLRTLNPETLLAADVPPFLAGL
jgi:predicted nucleic acid-binding protein